MYIYDTVFLFANHYNNDIVNLFNLLMHSLFNMYTLKQAKYQYILNCISGIYLCISDIYFIITVFNMQF